jgi:sialate O-acetylesterase
MATAMAAAGQLKLPAVIGENMVLQQKLANPIWGWDTPGTEVTVTFSGQTKVGKAAQGTGRWQVTLDPMPANSSPEKLVVRGTSTREVINILVGEVWICSGQSNMVWPVRKAWDSETAMAAAKFPQIRLLKVPNFASQTLENDFRGQWEECTPESVGTFSAVGYYFGRQLHQTLGVPVGMIRCAWGGSSAEAWVRRDLLEKDKRFSAIMDQWRQTEATYDFAKAKADYQKSLKEWQIQRDAAVAASGEVPPQPEEPRDLLGRAGHQRPGNLYGGLINPLAGFGIRGVIWYQGESNAGRAPQYHDLMSLLIRSWRDAWGQGAFPFYFVQLPNYKPVAAEPADSVWADLRAAQAMTLREVENTGMAVTIDLGEANDIHPRDKRDVAERLARWALVKDYGLSGMTCRSPEFESMRVDGNKAILTIAHAGEGLRTLNSTQAHGFAIRGADQKWLWAEAQRVPGTLNQIEVTHPQVALPVAVSYAWADNPVCNVYSLGGLPLTPFRTGN